MHLTHTIGLAESLDSCLYPEVSGHRVLFSVPALDNVGAFHISSLSFSDTSVDLRVRACPDMLAFQPRILFKSCMKEVALGTQHRVNEHPQISKKSICYLKRSNCTNILILPACWKCCQDWIFFSGLWELIRLRFVKLRGCSSRFGLLTSSSCNFIKLPSNVTSCPSPNL